MWREAGILLTFAAVLGIAAAQLPAQVPTDLTTDSALQHLVPLWKSYREERVSAEIEFDEDGFSLEKTVSQAQLAQLIEEFHLATDVEQIKPMLRTISPADYQDKFVSHRLWFDGKQRRFELGKTLFIDDPDYSFRYNSANKAVDVFLRGSSLFRFRELSDLRQVPGDTLPEPQLTGQTANTIQMSTRDTVQLG